MKLWYEITIFFIFCCMTFAVCKKRASVIRCYSCSARARELNNRTRCTTDTFSSTAGITCSSSNLCYTEMTIPKSGNGTIGIKRGCQIYNINTCITFKDKKGDTLERCWKSCDKDRCNVDLDISYNSSNQHKAGYAFLAVILIFTFGWL